MDDRDGSPYVFLDLPRLRYIRQRAVDGRLKYRFDLAHNVARGFTLIQRKAAAALGDEHWIRGTLHDLRKSFGTHAASVVPMHVLQQLMGHQSITTTADFYLAADERQLNDVRRMFSGMAG